MREQLELLWELQKIDLTLKRIKEERDRFPKEMKKLDEKQNIENALKELKKALTGDDIDEIKKKTDELSEILQKVSTNLYQKAAQKAASSQTSGSTSEQADDSWSGHPSDEDKTINADFKVKDEENKKTDSNFLHFLCFLFLSKA